MKLLREIDFIEQTGLKEGQGPVPLKLTLSEIIRDGKVTNHYQVFALAWLSEFFKNGLKSASLELENPIGFDSNATKTEVISTLKSLSPENQVQLAEYLLDCIDAGESALKNQESTIAEWIRLVLRVQE